jgi:hypothetical protein
VLGGHLAQLGLDRGALVLFDRRASAASLIERVRLEHATTQTGRPVMLLRA